MAWQQHVADVVLEIDPATGRLAYDEYVLTVPRQSGKSTFILSKFVHRCSATKFFGPRQRIVYMAQTRLKAREKMEEGLRAGLKGGVEVPFCGDALRERARAVQVPERVAVRHRGEHGEGWPRRHAGQGLRGRGVLAGRQPRRAGVRSGDDHAAEQAAGDRVDCGLVGCVAVSAGQGFDRPWFGRAGCASGHGLLRVVGA